MNRGQGCPRSCAGCGLPIDVRFAFPLHNGNIDLSGEDLINKDEKEKEKDNKDIITVMDSEEENVEDGTYDDDDVILAMGPWWGLWLGDERPQRDAAESPSSQPVDFDILETQPADESESCAC